MSLRDRFDVWAAAHPRQFALLIYAAAFVIVSGVLGVPMMVVYVAAGVSVEWLHWSIVAVAAALAALSPAHDAYRQHPATATTGGESA